MHACKCERIFNWMKELLIFLIEVSKFLEHKFKVVKIEWKYLAIADEILESVYFFEELVRIAFSFSTIDN